MKYLGKGAFYKSIEFIRRNARPLEKSYLKYLFFGGNEKSVLNELGQFQNDDGGFGNAIEPDIRMPFSSPISTSVGVRHLMEFDKNRRARKMIEAAIKYFEASFNEDRDGWFALDRRVNDYPHAPWWHFDEERGKTVIDENWGNPTAEIVAYVYKYYQYASKLNVEDLIDYSLKRLINKKEFNSENEVYCYIKLYEVLSGERKNKITEQLSRAIEQVIVYDSSRWYEYVPKPLDIVESPEKQRFSIPDNKINENLDFIINLLEEEGKIEPPWGQSFYTDDMKSAYKEWQGILTLKALKILNDFERLDQVSIL
ncbi:MAG: hypothetical protein R6U52_08105 [Kosmotogaceae bacterium]